PIWGGERVVGRASPRAGAGAGLLTGVALWAALNSLSAPSQAAYFNDHRYDPGYVQWRQEADREAARDPAVAAKLAQLDARLAQMETQPRSSSSSAPPETRSRPP